MTPAPEQPVRQRVSDSAREDIIGELKAGHVPLGLDGYDLALDHRDLTTALAERDATIREKDAEIERLKAGRDTCRSVAASVSEINSALLDELARRRQPDEAMVEAAGLAGMSAFSGLTGQDALEAFKDCKPIWTRTARGCLSVLAARPAEPGATRGDHVA